MIRAKKMQLMDGGILKASKFPFFTCNKHMTTSVRESLMLKDCVLVVSREWFLQTSPEVCPWRACLFDTSTFGASTLSCKH